MTTKKIKPGGTTSRGYGAAHQRLRRRFAREVATGWAVCARCRLPIRPDEAWDLAHLDSDPTHRRYAGVEHRRCNRRKWPPQEQQVPRRHSRDW